MLIASDLKSGSSLPKKKWEKENNPKNKEAGSFLLSFIKQAGEGRRGNSSSNISTVFPSAAKPSQLVAVADLSFFALARGVLT